MPARTISSLGSPYTSARDVDLSPLAANVTQFGAVYQLAADRFNDDRVYLTYDVYEDPEHLADLIATVTPAGPRDISNLCPTTSFRPGDYFGVAVTANDTVASYFVPAYSGTGQGLALGRNGACTVSPAESDSSRTVAAVGNVGVTGSGLAVNVTTGAVSRVPTWPAGVTLFVITAASDGAVWGWDGSKIWRIPLNGGAPSSFPLSNPSHAVLYQFAPDASGGVWFSFGASVVHIAPSGAMQISSVAPIAAAGGIAVGRDGALYVSGVTSDGRDVLGRLAWNGTFAGAILPNTGFPMQRAPMVSTPHGNLWLVRQSAYAAPVAPTYEHIVEIR